MHAHTAFIHITHQHPAHVSGIWRVCGAGSWPDGCMSTTMPVSGLFQHRLPAESAVLTPLLPAPSQFQAGATVIVPGRATGCSCSCSQKAGPRPARPPSLAGVPPTAQAGVQAPQGRQLGPPLVQQRGRGADPAAVRARRVPGDPASAQLEGLVGGGRQSAHRGGRRACAHRCTLGWASHSSSASRIKAACLARPPPALGQSVSVSQMGRPYRAADSRYLRVRWRECCVPARGCCPGRTSAAPAPSSCKSAWPAAHTPVSCA